MCVDAVVRAVADMGDPITVLHDACATLDLALGDVTDLRRKCMRP